MSLVKRKAIDFPTFMNEMLSPDWFGGTENMSTNSPAINIKDNETNFELELAVPGRAKSDFNIDVDNGLLTVAYEVKETEVAEKEVYTRRDFKLSSFKRTFTLPESVDVDKIDAAYENGILKFTLTKKEESLPKPKRTIELS